MNPKIMFEGNLTEDPEIRFTTSGKAVASFTIACQERVRDGAGGYKDGDATFVKVTAWQKLGEHVAESARKGDRLVVVGRLLQENWESNEGEKRSALRVTAESVGLSLLFGVTKSVRAGGVGGDVAAGGWPETFPKPDASDDEPPF